MLFSRIVLKSSNDARTFSALVRPPSVVVPGLLHTAVRDIRLRMDDSSRPWMYHVWALLRDGTLPNLESIHWRIRGANTVQASQICRNRCKVLLDIGLPRTMPSTHPIRLHTLTLYNLEFPSYIALLRCLAFDSVENVKLHDLRWPKEDTILAPTGRLLSQLSLHAPKEIRTFSCTAVLPLVWSLITAQFPSPGAVWRLLYINSSQIDAIMAILRLFSERCDCPECKGSVRLNYLLRVYTGV